MDMCHNTAKLIIQLLVTANAINMGWTVTHTECNKIILTKKIDKLSTIDKNISILLSRLIDFSGYKII